MTTGDPGVAARSPRPRTAVAAVAAALNDASVVLATADALTGRDTTTRRPTTRPAPDDPARCEAALDDAHHGVVRRLGDPDLTEADRRRLGAVLLQVGQVRASVREAAAAGRRELLPAVTGMMTRLRGATSTADLLATAPRAIAEVGYDRCLVSRVEDGRWIAQASYVRGDAELAHAMTVAGSEVPAPLDRRLLESELIRTRAPMLVRDAQSHPRVHRRLIAVTASTAYVAAPIQVGGAVVGFVHVDRTGGPDLVDDEDVEVVGLITECLGYALERTLQHERLQEVRASLAAWSATACELLDTGATVAPLAVAPARAPGPEKLTDREREVLERVAAGQRNADIAAGLFITHATVKAHVKHIFRKLGVATRAEAVSLYLRRP